MLLVEHRVPFSKGSSPRVAFMCPWVQAGATRAASSSQPGSVLRASLSREMQRGFSQ